MAAVLLVLLLLLLDRQNNKKQRGRKKNGPFPPSFFFYRTGSLIKVHIKEGEEEEGGGDKEVRVLGRRRGENVNTLVIRERWRRDGWMDGLEGAYASIY